MRWGHNRYESIAELVLGSPVRTLVFGILAICFGIFFAWISSTGNSPVSREEAVAYSGEFQRYETRKNHRSIRFTDGTSYDLYPYTKTAEFEKTVETLPAGTQMWLLVNPNNDYVVEIRTDTKELLNFEASQNAIDSYDNGYI